jgi:membrane-associated phospholipid phosphatase
MPTLDAGPAAPSTTAPFARRTPIAPTSERIWFTYLGTVVAAALLFSGGGGGGHRVLTFVGAQAAVAAVVLWSWWLARHRGHEAPRVLRAALAVIGLPVVFSSLCWILPHLHPEPFEYTFLALDRAWFGGDAGLVADHVPPPVIEVLQVVYASFYGICIASALGAGRGSGAAAFDRAVLLQVGGFLVSYLGYVLVPTLAPKVVLAFEHEVAGVWLTPHLRASIDAGEANPWDCFPSGHTMMTVTSLLILWRWNRAWFRWFAVPCVLLIVSTVVLRYHWTIDVVAGALLAWPVARACGRHADRDGWPPAPAGGGRVTRA